jgi:hypothetical protein
MRPGLGLSSSVASCCNQAASAYNRRKAAGARHPARDAERTLPLVVVCSKVPLNRHHAITPMRKGRSGIGILEDDSDQKCCESRPQLFHLGFGVAPYLYVSL